MKLSYPMQKVLALATSMTNSMENRPQLKNGQMVSHEGAIPLLELFGGASIEQVALTKGQVSSLYSMYGFSPEEHQLLEAGAFRDMSREARNDGLRLIAILSEICEPGQDPAKFLRILLNDAGYDVELYESDFDEE